MSIGIAMSEEMIECAMEGERIACEPWKWGTQQTYRFDFNDQTYIADLFIHSQEGVQDTYCTKEMV